MLHSLLTALADVLDPIKEPLKTLPQPSTDSVLKNALSLVFFILGALAIIMIVYSGFQLTTSAGNPGAIQKAKNTLIFSVIGLALAVLSYAIINFVIGNFS